MRMPFLWQQLRFGVTGYAVALLTPTAGTIGIGALDHSLRIPNVSLLYLPAILVTAVYFGTGPALLAATLAVAEYDFFLLQPVHTFTIDHPEDILAFVIFLIVAVLTGQLAAQARERVETAQRRARESTTLYELGRALMSTQEVDDILHALTERIVEVYRVERCAIFVPGAGNRLDLAAETAHGSRRTRAARSTVDWVFQQGTEMGLSGDPDRLDPLQVYVPLRTADRVVGVMEVGQKRDGTSLEVEERRLLTSFAAQAALVLARAQSERESRRLQVIEESDHLKSALLNAVSHDLRTPLSSIKASATALLLADASWTTEQGHEFLHAIDHEADRLNRLVGNLLDLSRIEAGTLRPVLDWYDVREIVEPIQQRLAPVVDDRPFVVDIERNMPPVQVDLLRIEELIVNLVENAVKYTPAGSPIELQVCRYGADLILSITDHGSGIRPEDRQRVFETFYQGRGQSDRQPGTGLGLAICRGVAQAHGGTIWVEDTAGGGATFVTRLPGAVLHAPVAR